MLRLLLTTAPVLAVIAFPLLIPITALIVGKLVDPFLPTKEPTVRDRLEARRRDGDETPGERLKPNP